MGAGASPGVAAATKAATPDELEGVIGNFSDEERGKLGSALAKKEKDALFDKVDLNKDGVIDPSEWAQAQEELLVPGAKAKTPLDRLLDALDKEGSGRLDGGEVAAAIDLFNSLEKREPLTTSPDDDELQKPKVGKDGKVGRKALEALITLFAEGPPARTAEQIVEVFQEMYFLRKVFLEWAGGKEQLEVDLVNEARIIFDKWALRTHTSNDENGRMIVNCFDRSKHGAELTLPRFTKWLWEEFKTLEEKFSLPFLTSLSRFRQSLGIASACASRDWPQLESVDAALFGPILAACDGGEWARTEAERRVLESRVAKRCGLELDGDGRLVAADLRRWVREEVIQCQLEHIPAVVARLAEFIPAAAQEEASFRVLRSFKTWDIGSRGTIGRQDLRSVMSKIDIFPPEEMDALIYGAKPNADGRIDYAEFTKWVLAAP